MKINAITRSGVAPSGWYRIGALKSAFEIKGIEINEIIPKVSSLPPVKKIHRPGWFLAALLERLSYLRRLKKNDITILQRELISTIPTIERLLPGRLLLDVDDAIFLNKKGYAAINAAKACVGVVCGNIHLADYFSKYNKNISIIPTGVDIDRMVVKKTRTNSDCKKIIGWIGTASNLENFNHIIPYLVALLRERKNQVDFRIVTSHASAIPFELRQYSTFVKWYPGIEFDEIPNWSLGLMPLIDSPWTRGKCSFKMLQYMSAGIPVVASPVGMNSDVLAKGKFGFGAVSGDDWYSAIEELINNESLNNKFGLEARHIVEENYSLEIVVDKWLEVLENWL